MGTRHRAAIGLLCLALVLTGCAKSHPRPGAQGASPSASTMPTPVETSPPVGFSPPPAPSGSLAELVLTGQVQPGVEAGCKILTDAGRQYELVGGDPAIVKVGARVRVVGHIAVGRASHCMQGQMLQVDEAHAL